MLMDALAPYFRAAGLAMHLPRCGAVACHQIEGAYRAYLPPDYREPAPCTCGFDEAVGGVAQLEANAAALGRMVQELKAEVERLAAQHPREKDKDIQTRVEPFNPQTAPPRRITRGL